MAAIANSITITAMICNKDIKDITADLCSAKNTVIMGLECKYLKKVCILL